MNILLLLIILIYNCNLNSTLKSSLTSYPADGKSGGKIIFKKYLWDNDKLILPKENTNSIEIISIQESQNKTEVFFKSTYKAGIVEFKSELGLSLIINFYPTIIDSDEDGFPDQAELSKIDEERFREWFVRIAISQYVRPNTYWNPNERDCAGLIRYSYREALKKHDENWYLKSGIILDKNLTDLESYSYPNVPILGENIFKIKNGSALEQESFETFANAETLFRWNTKFISKNIVEAKKGDLLFFENSGEINFPFHSMIVADLSKTEPMLIYHTGEGNNLKLVSISYLKNSKIFNISPENSHFLGIYRFHILE